MRKLFLLFSVLWCLLSTALAEDKDSSEMLFRPYHTVTFSEGTLDCYLTAEGEEYYQFIQTFSPEILKKGRVDVNLYALSLAIAYHTQNTWVYCTGISNLIFSDGSMFVVYSFVPDDSSNLDFCVPYDILHKGE